MQVHTPTWFTTSRCVKRAWLTRREARSAAPKYLNVYRCPACGHFHLTSQSKAAA